MKPTKYENNPFNIRYRKTNNWFGQKTPRNGFCEFVSMDCGIRAALIILRHYLRHGLNTPSKIIRRFAPSSDGNDVKAYINFTCSKAHVAGNEQFGSIYDDNFVRFFHAMSVFEQGYESFTLDELYNIQSKLTLADVFKSKI